MSVRLTESQKVLFLAGLGVVMVIVILSLSAWIVFSDDTDEVESTVVVPSSNREPESVQILDSDYDVDSESVTDWRVPVIDFETVSDEVEVPVNQDVAQRPEVVVPQPAPSPATQDTSSGPEHADLAANYNQYVSRAATTPTGPSPVVVPKVSVIDAIDCGTISVPSSGIGLMVFASSLASDPTIVCFGEAIANDCETATASVYQDQVYGSTAYIAKRSDNSCGIGAAEVTGDVLLCDVTTIMNKVLGENKTETAWQSQFAADPGGSLASVLRLAPSLLESGVSEADYDCEKVTLN